MVDFLCLMGTVLATACVHCGYTETILNFNVSPSPAYVPSRSNGKVRSSDIDVMVLKSTERAQSSCVYTSRRTSLVEH